MKTIPQQHPTTELTHEVVVLDTSHSHDHDHDEVGHACKREANPQHACCGRCKAVIDKSVKNLAKNG